MYAQKPIEVHGHRGCRGVFPENSIPAFLHAIEIGVDVLELDVVVNGEGELVVSHEPWINPEICQLENGDSLPAGKKLNIYHMTQEEIERYDCGSKYFSRFPDQKKIKTTKPRFRDLITAIRNTVGDPQKLRYNIEIKITQDWIGEYCPGREDFLSIYTQTMMDLGIEKQVILQCFDVPTLQLAKTQQVPFDLALLVQNFKGYRKNLKKLGFIPEIYSPYYKLITSKAMKRARKDGVQMVPWTVNSPKAIKKMIRREVNGIISDYPELVMSMLE